MNPRSLLFCLILSIPAAHAATGAGMIRFFNQNQLPGQVSSIEKDLIRWDSPQLEKPAPFFMNQVLEINQTPKVTETKEICEAVVSLTNGDSLRGQLSSVSDQAIELETWYAGKLTLMRPMVESVKIIDRPKLVYQGPDGLDGWKRIDEESAWTFEAGRFKSNGPGQIARDVKMPASSRVAFDLSWRSSLRTRIIVCSDDVSTKEPSNAYDLIIQRKYVYLRKRWSTNGGGGTNILGQTVNVPEFSENEKARVELCVDRKKGVFNFIVDGRSVAVWQDNDFKEGAMGGGLHFIADDSTPLTLSRIEVSEWDGVIDRQPAAEDPNLAEEEEEGTKTPPKKEEPAPGKMTLRNGDTLMGEVLGIEKGIMRVKTSYAELKMPVSRLKTIALKPVDREEAILKNGDVRAWFPDGSRVVFRLDSAATGGLQGFSQNFGTATFKPEAFNRIEFNLYDPKFQTLRGEKMW
jgi:hypothetical protein